MFEYSLDSELTASRVPGGPSAQNDRAGWGCCSGSTSGQQKNGIPPGRSPLESHPGGLEFKQEKGCDSSDTGTYEGWHVGLPTILASTVDIPTAMKAVSAGHGDRNPAQPANEEQT